MSDELISKIEAFIAKGKMPHNEIEAFPPDLSELQSIIYDLIECRYERNEDAGQSITAYTVNEHEYRVFTTYVPRTIFMPIEDRYDHNIRGEFASRLNEAIESMLSNVNSLTRTQGYLLKDILNINARNENLRNRFSQIETMIDEGEDYNLVIEHWSSLLHEITEYDIPTYSKPIGDIRNKLSEKYHVHLDDCIRSFIETSKQYATDDDYSNFYKILRHHKNTFGKAFSDNPEVVFEIKRLADAGREKRRINRQQRAAQRGLNSTV